MCQDHISAAMALLVHSREIRNEELKKMLSEKSHHHWREGMPHPKKDLILMRFATNGDKKLGKNKPENKLSDECYDQSMDSVSKNPWGDLCRSWGVYDHQEVFHRKLPKNDYEDEIEIEEPREFVKIKNKKMAMRLGKRSHKTEESEESTSDSEWKKRSKTPRMRMHADDEESKQKRKQETPKEKHRSKNDDREAYAPLSIEVINSRSHYTPRETTKLSDKFKSHVQSNLRLKRENIQSRLGLKVVPMEDSSLSDEYSSDDSDTNVTSRVQKISSVAKSTVSVWSRLQTKENTVSGQSDLRQILKSRKENKTDDLRERIGKSKKTNLRIEIDNRYESD